MTISLIIIIIVAILGFIGLLFVRDKGEMLKQFAISALIILGFLIFINALYKLPIKINLVLWIGMTAILETWRYFKAPRKPRV